MTSDTTKTARVEILYFSGFGHTQKQAEALHEGAAATTGAGLWAVDDTGTLGDDGWAALDAAGAIVFGSPTYMGGPAWQLKKVIDESSKRWMERAWVDKLAGGFTNSAGLVGDKGETLGAFQILAAQHGMLWVPLNQTPANVMASTADDVNWAGANVGAMAISPADAGPDQAPRKGDLESARLYGQRIATLVRDGISR